MRASHVNHLVDSLNHHPNSLNGEHNSFKFQLSHPMAMRTIKRTKELVTQISTITTVDPRITTVGCAPYSSSSSSSPVPDYPPSPATTRKSKKNIIHDRLSAVIDTVNDRKLPPELRGQRNNVRSETNIINVVEQRIWKSMEGHFENLPGKGKPLDLRTNPHADPAEDTLFRILSKNGCAPEWVELNKQIRTEAVEWRAALRKAWVFKSNGDSTKWIECSEVFKAQIISINNKVFRYNLVIPFGRQMFGIKWEKELDRLRES